MPLAAINGTTLYYETRGEGFPLIFVHGGFGGLGTGTGGTVPTWVARFAGAFQVILYDRRSSGRSAYPETRHTMEQFAGDVAGLLAHLGHERAHVWGTSAGGHIALAFALDHPTMTASLVIADSAPWLSRDPQLISKLKARIALLEGEGPEAAYQARREQGTVGLDLFAGARPAPRADDRATRASQADAIRAQLAKISREERIAKYAGELRTYSAYVDWDATSRFGELEMPVLVLYGTQDSVFPQAPWGELAMGRQNVIYHPSEGAEHGMAGNTPAALDEIHAFFAAHS